MMIMGSHDFTIEGHNEEVTLSTSKTGDTTSINTTREADGED
jgi:hypothetical protein